MNKRRPLLATLKRMLVAFPLLLMGGVNAVQAQSTQANSGVTLRTAPVTVETIKSEVTYDGVIEAVNQSTVSAQTSGRVVELNFDVGDSVKQNDVIVRLTTTTQRARSGAAEAALAEARAHLAKAQLDFDRIQDLYAKKLIAKAQLDQAAADLKSAHARYKAAQAALSNAREGLDYTVVRAPYSGVVVARHVNLGETVNPGKALMTGVSLKQLRVVVDIPQRHIDALRKHRQARVLLADGRFLTATKLRIPPNADPASHSFRVRVRLPQGQHGLYPGILVKVAFVTGESRQMLMPNTALVLRGEVTGAYVIDAGGQITLRYIRTASPLADGRIPVLAGLNEAERVALDTVAAAITYKKQTRSPGPGS